MTEITDLFGNRIEYLYAPYEGVADSYTNQPLLQQIRYLDYTQQGLSKFLFSVSFEYQARVDSFSEYRPGFELRTAKGYNKIVIQARTVTVGTTTRHRLNPDLIEDIYVICLVGPN